MKLEAFGVDLRKWLWVLYPVGVGLFIWISVSLLLGDYGQLLQKMGDQRRNSQTQKELLTKLDAKATQLRGVDLEGSKTDLKLLLGAVPSSKQLWTLVQEIRAGAGAAGATMMSYKGLVGEVVEATAAAELKQEVPWGLEVTFKVGNWDQVKTLVKELGKELPLIRIGELTYAGEGVNMKIEGVWRPWDKVSVEVARPLPEVVADMVKVRGQLQQMNLVEEERVLEASGSGRTE